MASDRLLTVAPVTANVSYWLQKDRDLVFGGAFWTSLDAFFGIVVWDTQHV